MTISNTKALEYLGKYVSLQLTQNLKLMEWFQM